MHRALAVVPLVLAACSPAPAEPIIHGETPGHTCKAEGTDQFIGKTSSKVEAAIKRVSNAAVVRVAHPGEMLTMDYRADRVTIWLDEAGKITKIRCG